MSKYKISLNLNFSLDTNLTKSQIEEIIEENIEYIFNDFEEDKIYDQSKIFSCDEIKHKELGRFKVGEFPVSEVLSNVCRGKKIFDYNNKKYHVNMNSQRYFMFKENIFCVCCGIKGTRMFLEYHPADMIPHFNLYGEHEGTLVLMTKDHILAKARGGDDRHSNYQTMCLTCNNLKGHDSLTLESLKGLRKIYDINEPKVTKKNLRIILEKNKLKLKNKFTVKNKKLIKKDCLATNCDLACYIDEKKQFYGTFFYESNPKNHKRVGCIKKGTFLEVILEYKNKTICNIGGNQSITLHSSLLSK